LGLFIPNEKYENIRQKLQYVLIAIGPFLSFLLKTLPSSLPNDGGVGSGDNTCSTGCCVSLFVSLSNNRLYILISDSSVILLKDKKNFLSK